MPEIPDPQPTTVIAWAETSGNIDQPSPAVKTAGWQQDQIHPSNNENWVRRETARHADHNSAIAIRTFDNVREAIDTLNPSEVFRIAGTLPRRFGEPLINIPLAGTDEAKLIACDGLNFYAVDSANDEVVAYRADPLEALLEIWRVTAETDPLRIKTDGALVAIASATPLAVGVELLVLNALTGATVLQKPLSVDCLDAQPDTDFDVGGGGGRVYYTDGDDIRIWTSGVGDFLFVAAPGNVLALTTTADTVIAITDDASPGLDGLHIIAYDKGTPGAGDVLASFPSWPKGSTAAIVSDGARAYFAIYQTPGAPAPPTRSPWVGVVAANGPALTYVSGRPLWTLELATAGVAEQFNVRIEVDDRYIYVMGVDDDVYALDKATGALVWHQPSDVHNFCIDGTYIWQTIGPVLKDEVNALGTGRLGGLWLRAGSGESVGGDDGALFGSRRRPFRKLALPIR